MEKNNLPFQYTEKGIMSELLENVNEILKDSDAAEEKKIVKEFLQKVSKVFQFSVLGDSAVGKTTLLQYVFGEELIGDILPTTGIIDYRYGEENGEFEVNETVTRIFRPIESIKGISVVDMQGVDQMKNPVQREAVQQYVQRSDVLIVVFSCDMVKSFNIWDLLENTESAKVVFVLTKADIYPEGVIEQSKNKLRQYMQDAQINAPVFASNALDELKDYINSKMIGANPELRKQRKNVLELKHMLDEVEHSFMARKRQYEADLAVVSRINAEMDGFRMSSREKVDGLKQSLRHEINAAIDDYEREIIKMLEPKEIKENFHNESAFAERLNIKNEQYRYTMTVNVDRKTQEVIRSYLSDLELVFERATGYFTKRESILDFEDKFYGSMSQSKQQMVVKIENDLQETKSYYGKLTNASNELFCEVWNARETYDRNVSMAETIGGAAGGAAGGILTGVATKVISKGAEGAAKGAASAVFMTGGLGLVLAGAVVGGVAISVIAKKFASAKNGKEMEQRVMEARNDFRVEVSRTKEQMTDRIMETIDAIFKRELDSADKTFLDFRMSVNIDARNIPLLEERMEKINVLMNKIEEIEKERSLEC